MNEAVPGSYLCIVPLINESGSASVATYSGTYEEVSGAYCDIHTRDKTLCTLLLACATNEYEVRNREMVRGYSPSIASHTVMLPEDHMSNRLGSP